MRQPRVIAEVIGGIVLGPSVMMRIDGFQETIFPTPSMPILNLVANLGLVLFLFLVGLEVNMKLFMHNWRIALSVGLAGMALPFGLGGAIAYGLYNEFHGDPGTVELNFGVYLLFIGTALSVSFTAKYLRLLYPNITDYRLPCALSNSHRIETSRNSSGSDSSCCRCGQRCSRMDSPSSLRCARQQRLWARCALCSTRLHRLHFIFDLRGSSCFCLDSSTSRSSAKRSFPGNGLPYSTPRSGIFLVHGNHWYSCNLWR